MWDTPSQNALKILYVHLPGISKVCITELTIWQPSTWSDPSRLLFCWHTNLVFRCFQITLNWMFSPSNIPHHFPYSALKSCKECHYSHPSVSKPHGLPEASISTPIYLQVVGKSLAFGINLSVQEASQTQLLWSDHYNPLTKDMLRNVRLEISKLED